MLKVRSAQPTSLLKIRSAQPTLLQVLTATKRKSEEAVVFESLSECSSTAKRTCTEHGISAQNSTSTQNNTNTENSTTNNENSTSDQNSANNQTSTNSEIAQDQKSTTTTKAVVTTIGKELGLLGLINANPSEKVHNWQLYRRYFQNSAQIYLRLLQETKHLLQPTTLTNGPASKRISCKFVDKSKQNSNNNNNNNNNNSDKNKQRIIGYDHLPEVDWSESPTIMQIKEQLEKQFGVKYGYCLEHLYQTGEAPIAWHNDKEAWSTAVTSVSFGVRRKFRLRRLDNNNLPKAKNTSSRNNNSTSSNISKTKAKLNQPLADSRPRTFEYEYALGEGDVLQMDDRCQRYWEHAIVPEINICTDRLNLTFREEDDSYFSRNYNKQ
jgi:alkylated DNA repair dioxygenase AlkB